MNKKLATLGVATMAMGMFAAVDGHTKPRKYCREYTTHIMIDGERVKSYGTACRQRDGSWELVSAHTQKHHPVIRKAKVRKARVIRSHVYYPRHYAHQGKKHAHKRHCNKRRPYRVAYSHWR